jgi:hypothetical protein
MTAIGVYNFKTYVTAPGDVNTVNDTLLVTRNVVSPVGGTVSSTLAQLCVTGTPTLTLTGNAGGNIQWQESNSSSGPWINVGTNATSYTPATPITTTMYYQAVISCNANNATSNVFQVTVNNPQVLSVTPGSRCGPGTVALSAAASAGATLNWYSAASGGTPIGTGAFFVTPVVNATTTYYVAAEFSGTPVCASARQAVLAVVTPGPTFTVTPNTTICNGAIKQLTVTSPQSNFNTYTWSPATGLYTDAAATIPYVAGSSATTVYMKQTTGGTYTYVANANNSTTSCSGIDSTKITVLNAGITLAASPAQICVSGSTTLVISPATGFGAATFQWYSSPNGTTYTPITGATAAFYTTPTLTATTYYRLDVKDAAGNVCQQPTITITVNSPQVTATTPAAQCGPGSLTLQATGSAGTTLNWYSAATGGTLLGSGGSFTTPNLTATTTYYVAASSGSSTSTVGLSPTATTCGTIASNTATDWPLRFNTTAPVTINSAFVIPVTAGNLTVALRNSLSTTDLQTATFTFTAAQVGIPQQINLGFSVPTSGSYQLTNSAGGVYRIGTFTCAYPYTSANGGFSIVGSATFSTSTTDQTQYNSFYNINITEGCESPRVAVAATINTTTAITTQPQSQTVCAGSNVALNVVAGGSGLTYQWRKNNGVISGATSSTLTINNAQVSDGGTYDVIVTGICGTLTSTTATLTVNATGTWLGTTSADWNTASNWCGGVPTASTDVIIPSGTPFAPIINNYVANARNVTVNTGASLTTTAGASFNIYGNYANSGTLNATTGFIFFRGTTNQTVSAMSAANIVINGAGGITLTGPMVATTLVLQNGNITIGANNITVTGSVNGTVASHIITNGTGKVISNAIGAGPVIIPVGPDATNYNPVTIANGQGANYSVSVATGINPAITNSNYAVNRTWNITPSVSVASNVAITLQYADAHGNSQFVPTAPVEIGRYTGTGWYIITPPNGVTPLGTTTDRQVTGQTTSFGQFVVTSPGGITYITAVPVVNADVQQILLMPNPVQDRTLLRVVSRRAMKIQFNIIDAAGKSILSFTQTVTAGTNDIPLDVSKLSRGAYMITGATDKGRTEIIRFIKL